MKRDWDNSLVDQVSGISRLLKAISRFSNKHFPKIHRLWRVMVIVSLVIPNPGLSPIRAKAYPITPAQVKLNPYQSPKDIEVKSRPHINRMDPKIGERPNVVESANPDPRFSNSQYSMAPPSMGIVLLKEGMFSQKDPDFDAVYSVIHEFGHVFDTNGSHGNPDLYKSQTFVTMFAPNCDTGWLGCLSPTQTVYPPVLNFGSKCSGYNVSDADTTKYGTTGSLDDFAESFAVVIFEKNSLAPPGGRTINSRRRILIDSWIKMY